MDPQVPTSFIPKAALQQSQRGGGMGLFFLLALFIFIASLFAAGAAFAFEGILKGQIAQSDDSLRRAEGAFDASSIQDLLRMDSRINQAQTLLGSHVSPSAVFTFLSGITLERVQYDSFAFQFQPDGSGSLVLSGVADSFSSVALQSDQFSASKGLKDVIFSGISVGDGGKVSFTVNATVDRSMLLYSKNLPAAQ